MNTYKLETMIRQIKELKADFDQEHEKLMKAADNTADFLNTCKKVGLTKVCIRRSHKIVKESLDFPFGAHGSVFGTGPKSKAKNQTWPLIWKACEEFGIESGCGNFNQRQISPAEPLVDGVYELRKGAWIQRA